MTTPPTRSARPSVSVIVPLLNEEENLIELHRRLTAVLPTISSDFEMILVDDGSTDRSIEIIRDLARTDPHVRYVTFSRNFGHEPACTAGLERARGDVVVLMDADLQDPPELIPAFLDKWREEYDIVYARRRRRIGESVVKRSTAWLFYRLLNAISEVNIPRDVGNFRLMDRCAVGAYNRLPERSRFTRGMVAWLGFRQTGIEYDRPARSGGSPKYSYVKSLCLALDALTGFSTALLRLASILGLAASFLSFVLLAVVLVKKVFFSIPVPGFTMLAVGLFFIGGTILLSLGIVGEYVAKTYRQVQGRPFYVVSEENDHRA
jgi:glycosyltransferase involved in cell wall biosynthesis